MSTATVEAPAREWVSAASAARRLGPGVKAARVADWGNRGLVATRRLPGCRTIYRLADVVRLAERSVRPATVQPLD